MLVGETVTYLEMKSRSQLTAGRPAPQPIEMKQASAEACPLLREMLIRVGDFLGEGFQARRIPPWTVEEWTARLATPGVHEWLICIGEATAGLLEIVSHGKGEAEIYLFALLPEFLGQGYGGDALTQATNLAWDITPIDGVPVERIWLHTTTRDHQAALPNYLARGFEVFRTEHRQREVQLHWTDDI